MHKAAQQGTGKESKRYARHEVGLQHETGTWYEDDGLVAQRDARVITASTRLMG